MQGRRCEIGMRFRSGPWAESHDSRETLQLEIKEMKLLNLDWVLSKRPSSAKGSFTRHYCSSRELYMHLWMWHLRRRMSREVLDACLAISLEWNYNLFQHIKGVKADQCHPLLMYKTDKKKMTTLLLTVVFLWDSCCCCCTVSAA